MTSVKEMLLKGAKFLETHKWHRGSMFQDKNKEICTIDKACSYCAIGAIAKANNISYVNQVYNNLNYFIVSPGLILEFNDYRARDKREVVRFLRRLAKQL